MLLIATNVQQATRMYVGRILAPVECISRSGGTEIVYRPPRFTTYSLLLTQQPTKGI